MPGPTFLRGETIALCPIEPNDAAFLAETIDHPEVWPTLSVAEPKSNQAEREWIEEIQEGNDVHLLICVEDEPVGTVGLDDVNETWGLAELGYYVHPDYQGNGYATDATRRIVRYAFEDRRLHKLYADVLADNEVSQHVLETVGFEREGVHRSQAFIRGTYRDVHRYGLLAGEFDVDR